jgi:hypothetical protein
MTASPASSIDQARALLEQVTGLAIVARPGDLETGHALLERAAGLFEGMLGALRNQPGEARAASRDALAGFARELKKVAALYQQAGAFHLGWLRLVEEFSGAAYSPHGGEGLPALTAAGRRVSLVA